MNSLLLGYHINEYFNFLLLQNDCGVLAINAPSISEALSNMARLERMIAAKKAVEGNQDFSAPEIGQEIEIPFLEEGKVNQGTCPSDEDVEKDQGENDLFMQRELRRKYMLMNPGSDPFNLPMADHTYSTKQWNPQYLTLADQLNMETFQSNILPLNTMKDGFKWVKYRFNQTHPEGSTILCGLCNQYSHLANIKPEDMDKMSRDEGVLYATKNLNLNAMRRHQQQNQHNSVRVLQFTYICFTYLVEYSSMK